MAIALIMAGGRGERLWPLSRRKRPKQFAHVFDRTLFQLTVERILPLVGTDGVYVATVDEFRDEVLREMPDLSRDHLLIEPVGRNTAPCIGLAALHVSRSDPDEVMMVLPSDHLIAQEEVLRQVLTFGCELAGRDHLVTLGIVPNSPHTGYGYIHRNDRPLLERDHMAAYQVREFTEKPDQETARRYVAEGRSLWNSGMFCWKAGAILAEIEQFMPDLHRGLAEIGRVIGSASEGGVTQQVFETLESQSIDYGVLEKTSHCVVIPTDPGWNDLGSWLALQTVYRTDASGNQVQGNHLGIDTSNCLIDSRKVVVTLGLSDLVIVEQDDVLFIMPKSRSQDIKRVIKTMNENPDFRQYL